MASSTWEMPFTVVCVLHLMCTNTHTRELYHPMGLPTILKSRWGSYKETLSTISLCQRLEYVMGKAIDGRGSDLGSDRGTPVCYLLSL